MKKEDEDSLEKTNMKVMVLTDHSHKFFHLAMMDSLGSIQAGILSTVS